MRWPDSGTYLIFGGDVEPRSSTHNGVSVSQLRATSPSPLERRLSRCEVCADEVGSGPPDEPRKSFMKFWVTDAIQFREIEPRLCLPVYARARNITPAPTSLYFAFPSCVPRMSTLPLRYAPSSMEMRCAEMSPVTTADFRNSTCSLAWTFPSSLPCPTTPLASTLALTWPCGPTVKLLPFKAMVPSTWPST